MNIQIPQMTLTQNLLITCPRITWSNSFSWLILCTAQSFQKGRVTEGLKIEQWSPCQSENFVNAPL